MSDHSTSSVGTSTRPYGDVDQTGAVWSPPTTDSLPVCVFVDIDALVDGSHAALTDIRHQTTERHGYVGDGHCEAEQGNKLRRT